MHKSPEEIEREKEAIDRTEQAGRSVEEEGQRTGARPPILVPPVEPDAPLREEDVNRRR